MSSPFNSRHSREGNAPESTAQRSEVVEEQPSMRAVALMSSGPSLIEGNRFGGPSFAKAPPLGISRPPVGLKPLQSSQLSKGSFDVKQEWSGGSSTAAWSVKPQDLQELPDFPLERTHREVKGVGACVVSHRISEALRELSVEAEFDCEKAKAKCKTEDYVSFRIRLYAGGENGDPVVVEVQRRCGSSASFMRTCRAILDAAEGKSVAESTASRTKRGPPFMSKPISQMKCLHGVVDQLAATEEEVKSSLDGVVEMLRSPKPDQNVLGLENLCALTDPTKTAPKVALQVSKCVVLCDMSYDVREEIRVLTERDVFSLGIEQDTALRHMDQLRHLALGVLSNALSMCCKDGCLRAALEEQKWFAEQLIPSLVDELKRASTSTCNAYQAACCIHSIVSCSSRARRTVLECGGLETIQEAHLYGQPRHALLAEETIRCIKALQG